MEVELLLQDIAEIKHHVEIMNSELGEVVVKLAVLENQVASMMWLERLVLGAIILSLIASVLSFMLVKRNGKIKS